MGYALAEECAQKGANVQLISGPVQLKAQHPNINVIAVESAADMYHAATQHFTTANAAILCAAVADFTPIYQADSKIKRGKDDLTLQLQPTQDIAAALGRQKKSHQVLVGFALETDNEAANATDKLQRKNLDFIVLNSLKNPGTCFGHDNNQVAILDSKGGVEHFPLKTKQEVAKDIINTLCKWLEK